MEKRQPVLSYVLSTLPDQSVISGDHSGGVTPDPIPNAAVKPSSADGTARVTVWESRSLPGFFVRKTPGESLGFFHWFTPQPLPIPFRTSACD